MTSAIDDGAASHPKPIPSALAAGLDLFAAAWLEEWAKSGGFVSMDEAGKAWIGFAEFHCSPAFEGASQGLPDNCTRAYDGFLDGKYNGKMRGMLDLLDRMPHGLDAIKAHMRMHGMICYASPTMVKP